jgi:hypothetical protein
MVKDIFYTCLLNKINEYLSLAMEYGWHCTYFVNGTVFLSFHSFSFICIVGRINKKIPNPINSSSISYKCVILFLSIWDGG